MLHTLSNLTLLRNTTVPSLISQFESDFSIALPDERKQISDVLSQIDTRLFQSYTRPHVESISITISTAIADPTWAPTARPTSVRPYVYKVLLHLVSLHAELSTTAETLTTPVLSALFETICKSLLEAFRQRASSSSSSSSSSPPSTSASASATGQKPFSLFALMQATLDVEFFAQTLGGLFGTERASEMQSAVYVELDRAGDARALQAELPEMRGVLKRLKDGTRAEFACFRREKRAAGAANAKSDERAGTPAR
jgi:exocyst complex component 2